METQGTEGSLDEEENYAACAEHSANGETHPKEGSLV